MKNNIYDEIYSKFLLNFINIFYLQKYYFKKKKFNYFLL